jgi:EAL domain-containing protein (putative c-di-GMP-specific phosphodiesterase class I)
MVSSMPNDSPAGASSILQSATALGEMERVFERVLSAARRHLDLDVAWISEFVHGQQVLQHVTGDGEPFGVAVDWRSAQEDSYCVRVLRGDLPNLIPDARADERTRDLPVTADLGIGAYAGVPVRLPSGEVYGMLCCLGQTAHPELAGKDMRFLQVLAEVLAEEVERRRAHRDLRADTVARIDAAIAGRGLRVVFQPIVSLATLDVIGVEALSRFEGGPPRPDLWFAEAVVVQRAMQLEEASIAMAVAQIADLADSVYLSVNASPELVCDWAERALPEGVPYDRLVVEITEHAATVDYDVLARSLDALRERGVRVAIDDAGAGYSSFRHVLQVRPDVIKLDMTLTRDIDSDPGRRALARALIDFAREVGVGIVAEGVETPGELAALRDLGVDAGQGYLFARPGPLPVPHRIDLR